MKDQINFSELGAAYSLNLHNLNEARKIFETEAEQLSEKIGDLLKESVKSQNRDTSNPLIKICTWGEVRDESTVKEGNWIKFKQCQHVGINLKVEGKNNFRNGVASLKFEIGYDDQERRFLFKVRFENHFDKNELLDEKVYELASRKPSDFPSAKLIRASTALVGCWELNEELCQNFSVIVLRCLKLVQETIGEIYDPAKLAAQSGGSPLVDKTKDSKSEPKAA